MGDGGLRRRLADGETAIGPIVFEFNTIGLPRIAASAEADFLLFDLEHTGWSLDALRPAIAACRASPVSPLVRVQGARRELISPALDVGAEGVMVPMIEDAEQAARIVSFARFPPAGGRGFGMPYPDQVVSGIERSIRDADDEALVIAQVETAAGLASLDQVAAVHGIDVLFLGLFDLSISLGVPGDFDHPNIADAAGTVLDRSTEHGLTAGTIVGGVDQARAALDRGFRFVVFRTDVALFAGALRADLAAIRSDIGRA